MNRFLASVFLSLVVAAALIGVPGADAQTDVVTTSVRIPLPQPNQRFAPCAAGGAGEIIDLSGTLHFLSHTALDGAGGFHSTILRNPQGVTGVGLMTGDVYRGTGGSHQHAQLVGEQGKTLTRIGNFRLVGPGTGNDLILGQHMHITVNANGVMTIEISDTTLDCR